nr:hypothetical protein [Tanacetum cinerariifolium]
MARLAFCDYHNRVAILEKSEHNVDFHPIVDFVEESPVRRARIAQSSALLPVADEPASPLRDVSQVEACPTARVKLLEDREGGVAERSGDDAPIKGRRLDEREEAAKKGSNDTKEMINVLTSMDAATILSSGIAKVPTGSGSIPTVGPPATGVPTGSDVVPTATPIFATATVVTPYTRRKGKEKMIESETLEKKKIQEQMDIQMTRQLEEEMERDAQRMNEKIARDAEIARIHAEEEPYIMIDGLDRSNETVAKYLQEYHQFATELPIERRIELISDLVRYQDNYAKAKDFKGMKLKEIKENFDPVWKQILDFIPIGSKEEAERFKRKGIRFEQESVKKLKTSKEVKATEEVPKEKVKEMIQLIPVEEHLDREDFNQLWRLVKETLSIRPPTIEWKLYDTCGVHHVTSKDKEIFMLVEKDYPFRTGLAIVMICYKLQGRIVGNKMHKAFLLPVMKFLLPGEVPTGSKESSHWQRKRDATGEKIAVTQ